MNFHTSKSSVSQSPKISVPIKSILIVVLAILGIFVIQSVLKPKEMTLPQFLEAKKNHRSGGFIIEGTVEEYKQGWASVVFKDKSGKELSTLQIGSEGVRAFVSYYPNQLPNEINTGDSVRITGDFATVPYYGGHPSKGNQKMTTATLSSIEIIRKAPIYEEE